MIRPREARAQRARRPLIGFLSSRGEADSTGLLAAFRKGLAESGYVEGRDVDVVYRWAEGNYERLPSLAAEIVGRKVDAIYSSGGPPTVLALKRATGTIPIVFSAVGNPLEIGVVRSLSHPGGNVTGMSVQIPDVVAKQLELLKEAMPQATALAIFENPVSPSFEVMQSRTQAAARSLKVRVERLRVSRVSDFAGAFMAFGKSGASGLAVPAEPFYDANARGIIELAQRHRVPGCYGWREYAEIGGLMSYGSNLMDSYRRAAVYVGRILRGERAGDLPVQQPTVFDLVVNLKTASALGIAIPPSILIRANEVIE